MVLAPRIHGSDLKKISGIQGISGSHLDRLECSPSTARLQETPWICRASPSPERNTWMTWMTSMPMGPQWFNVRLQETVWNSCPSLSKLSQSGYPRHYILLYIYRPTGVFSIRSHSSSTLCRRNSGWCPVSIISGGQVWNRPYDTLRYSYIHV